MGTKIFKKRFYLESRCLGKLFFLPCIISIIDISICILFFFDNTNEMTGRISYRRFLLLSILPVLIWWITSFLKKYIDDFGNEIIYVYEKKRQFWLMSKSVSVFILMISPSLIVSFLIDKECLCFLLWIIIYCVHITSIVYCISFLTKNITLTYILGYIYFLCNIIVPEKYSFFPFFYHSLGFNVLSELWRVILPMMLSIFTFTFFGILLNKKFDGYN